MAGRQLTDDARQRLAGRLKSIETPTIRVYPLSLEPDPIHPSSYYLAVDGLHHDRVTPLLLRFGLASSPASGLFPKSVLIGRMRPAGGREVVVNAIPFGPTDGEPVRTFTEKVAKSFLPRPQGPQPALIVSADDLAISAPPAFDAFRQIDRATGQNRASFAVDFTATGYVAVLWAAVRAGWRDGYSLGVTGIPAHADSLTPLESLGGFTRYSVRIMDPAELAAAGAIYDHVRRVKSGRIFDFELDCRALVPSAVGEVLQTWRSGAGAVHSVMPPADANLEDLATQARQCNALLTLEGKTPFRGRVHRAVRNPTTESLVELSRE